MQRFRSHGPGGALLLLFVLALATLGGTAPTASGDTPTPSPVPPGAATISVFFTADGIPTAGPGPISQSYVNGQPCNWITATVVFATLSWQVPWPPVSTDPNCYQQNPSVSICADICSEPFQFTGQDASVVIDYPVPPGLLLVTARFQSASSPAGVDLAAIEFRAGPFLCHSMGGSVPVPGATGYVTPWASSDVSGPCTADGADISVTAYTTDYGELTGAFTWDGASADAFIEVPVTATPSPTPDETPSPTSPPPPPPPPVAPTPASLPDAGGQPESASRQSGIALAMIGAIAAVAAAIAAARRSP